MEELHPQKSDEQMIHIQVLGGFSFTQGDVSISDMSNRTHQLWNLLAYLVLGRRHEISRDELLEALWPESDGQNLSNALKNLVYRIRAFFEAQGFAFARDMIIFEEGVYKWNNQLPCIVDAESFAKKARAACESPAELQPLLNALQMYTGNLLPSECYAIWAAPRTNEYREQYMECFCFAIALLNNAGKYGESERLCRAAVEIAPLDDRAHCELIHVLLKQNRREEALDHYNRATALSYLKLGERPSSRMRESYRSITKTIHDIETDLETITHDLRESLMVTGAFYCDYEVFKDMYRVEARCASRENRNLFIGLMTVTDTCGVIPDSIRLSVVMSHLYGLIQGTLRKGDMFCRFSAAQYMVMLPTHTPENGYKAMARICQKLRKEVRFKDVCIQTALQSLDPV